MDDDSSSPVLAPKPKQKDIVREELVDNSPSKGTPSAARNTSSQSKSSKSKRKAGADDVKGANGTPAKKVKTENVGGTSVDLLPMLLLI